MRLWHMLLEMQIFFRSAQSLPQKFQRHHPTRNHPPDPTLEDVLVHIGPQPATRDERHERALSMGC